VADVNTEGLEILMSTRSTKKFAAASAIAMVSVAGSANAEFLTGAAYYTSAVASSEFSSSYVIGNIFDNDMNTQWAISSYAQTNPQGRDVGWFSFTLDQAYSIDAIRLAPRFATGTVDGFDTVNIWVGTSSFGVDVTSASSTSSFLATNTSASWSRTGNFSGLQTFTPVAPIVGQYVLVQLINTSDNGTFRNLGLREFAFSANAVPAPGAIALLGLAGLAGRRRR
jgi:MYXO-CTERM domain-containing protein